VYLGVCPVQFALYVKLRTALRADHVFCDWTINKYLADNNEHVHACRCDTSVKNGSSALSRPYIFSSLKFTD